MRVIHKSRARMVGLLAFGMVAACNGEPKDFRQQIATTSISTATTSAAATSASVTKPLVGPKFIIDTTKDAISPKAFAKGQTAKLVVRGSGMNIVYVDSNGRIGSHNLHFEVKLPEGVEGKNGVKTKSMSMALKNYNVGPNMSQELEGVLKVEVEATATIGTRDLYIMNEEGGVLSVIKEAISIVKPKVIPRYPETTDNPCLDPRLPVWCEDGVHIGKAKPRTDF